MHVTCTTFPVGCLLTFLMAFGHLSCHHQHQHSHSSQFCVFQAHHQEPEKKARLHTVALSYITKQSVAELCSGPLKYFTRGQAKGCLHPPGTKWWGPHPDNRSVEVLLWHLSQSTTFCYKICLNSWLLNLSLNYKGKVYNYYTYLIEELHAAYAQEWEEVTNAQQQELALKRTMTV